MKKVLSVISIFVFLFLNWFIYAQDDIAADNVDLSIWWEDTDSWDNIVSQINNIDSIIDETEVSTENQANLIDIYMWFCNEWIEDVSDSLKSAISQWTPFKICVLFENKWDVDAVVQIDLVDKSVNPEWYEICNYNSHEIQNFVSQSDLDSLSEITIPAHNYLVKEFSVNFPIWVGWEQKSCFTYHMKEINPSSSSLSIRYSRYHDMDFFVWDVWDINNEIDLNNINLYLNENKFLQLDFNISNIWNLENQVVVHGTLSNIFWFKKDFEFNVGNIWVWWFLTGEIDLWPLPSYGWLFNVTMTATATPFFSYNVDESLFDKDLLEPKDFTITASYFQMPWIAIIIFIFVIMFIVIAFRKPKKEVVYVQAPQWPMPNNGYQQPQYPYQPPISQ